MPSVGSSDTSTSSQPCRETDAERTRSLRLRAQATNGVRVERLRADSRRDYRREDEDEPPVPAFGELVEHAMEHEGDGAQVVQLLQSLSSSGAESAKGGIA